MADPIGVIFTTQEAERIDATVKAYEKKPQYVLPRKKRRRLIGSGGACACPEIWCFIPLACTSGTWDMDLSVNSSNETLTFNWNTTSAQFGTELATHSELTGANFSVSGGDFPSVAIYVTWVSPVDSDITGFFPSIDISSLTGNVTMYKFSTAG